MALITPLKGLAAPTAASVAKSLNLNGPIANGGDMIQSAILEAQELQNKIKQIIAVTDSADPNLSALNTAVTTLS